MAETPQQYTQRILGFVQDRAPLEVLEETPLKLAELVAGRKDGELGRRPAPEKWSVAEILAHLADAEMVVGFRVRLMLGQNGVAIQAFDQDEWAKFSHYEKSKAYQSLERLRVQRHANLELFRSLSAAQWEQYGMHSERGKETVAHTVKMLAGHDLNHRSQLTKILGG